jgi:hypothetical protein
MYPLRPYWRRRHRRSIFVLISAAFVLLLLYSFSTRLLRPAVSHPPYQEIIDAATKPEIIQPEEKELVVASLADDDTTWLHEFFDGWRKNIYVVNDPAAPLTIAVNKGREAMPFLTYVVARDLATGTERLNRVQIYHRPLRRPAACLHLRSRPKIPVA